ncbi:hypothetical protein [Actinomadura sp. KC06]|nr:hypothetical protein [Actinomadura sp. KC06]
MHITDGEPLLGGDRGDGRGGGGWVEDRLNERDEQAAAERMWQT